MSDPVNRDEPRTEAGRYRPKKHADWCACPGDGSDPDCNAPLHALREARAALLAELRAKVEGLREPTRGFVSSAYNSALDAILALLSEDPA